MTVDVPPAEENGRGTKRTRKREEAIAALLQKPTIKEAAEQIGVGETTLHRWLSRERFQQEYRKARRQAVRQAISRMQQASSEAVDTLQEIMTNDEAHEGTRVRAAKIILEKAVETVEIEQLEERINDLEAVLEGRK